MGFGLRVTSSRKPLLQLILGCNRIMGNVGLQIGEPRVVIQLNDVQDHVIHHSANAAAMAMPLLVSAWLHVSLPVLVALAPSLLGSVWYVILIGEWLYGVTRKRERKDGIRDR